MLFTDSVNLWWHFGQLTIHVVIDQLERAMHWCDRAKQTVRGGGTMHCCYSTKQTLR